MEWIQIMNGEGLNNYSKMFGVTGYPTKFVLSPEGKILRKFVGEGEHRKQGGFLFHQKEIKIPVRFAANSN